MKFLRPIAVPEQREPSSGPNSGSTNLLARRLLEILEHLGIGVATFDFRGESRLLSPNLFDLLGAMPRNVEFLIDAVAVEPDDRRALRLLVESAKQGEDAGAVRFRRTGWSGSVRLFSAQAIIVGDEELSELALLVIELGAEALPEPADLERLSRLAALGQTAAGVAHEFNNILTSVLGWTQLARQSVDDPSTADQALRIIEDNARRAKLIAGQMLAVPRSKADASERRVAALTDIADGVLKLVSWELNKAGIRVVRSFDDPALARVDEHRISQVFLNLARNALDAMAGSGGGGTLAVAVRRRGQTVEVSFRDTGSGVPAAIRDKIFTPFFTTKRLQAAGTGGGAGMGLAICRDIVSDHGGAIGVTSDLGRGSCFTVSLPAAPESAAPIAASPREAPARPTVPPGSIVLVADDEPDIGEMVRTSLELKGVTVLAAGSGEEALALARQTRLDAAFIDFSMPGLAGHDLGRELLAVQPELPIVFMSGLEVDGETPIADFLKKPFDLDDIQNKLRDLLKRRAGD